MFPSALTTRHWKKAEAERIVAGQPVHAFLSEQQNGVEFLLAHAGGELVQTGGVFLAFKMQGHGRPP
jgi:hypothetical protein